MSIITMLAVASCQEYSVFDENVIKHDVAVNQYNKNFIERYGTPDPNHTWGFGTPAMTGNAATRGAIDVNTNQWLTRLEYIPGFDAGADGKIDPNGNCRVIKDGKIQTVSVMEAAGYKDNDPEKGFGDLKYLPAGDVTDEEIAYVSWWLRTHKLEDGAKEYLPTGNFFIQMISADIDRDATGNALNKGNIKITDRNGVQTQDMASANMDKLEMKQQDGTWVHLNNNNSGNSNVLWGKQQLNGGGDLSSNTPEQDQAAWNAIEADELSKVGPQSNRLINFYTQMATEQALDFQATYSNDGKIRNYWSLVHLTFTVKGQKYDGWYLGFDYEFCKEDLINMKTEKTERDHFHSNWVFKITPAYTTTGITIASVDPEPETIRVMCEDLGDVSDFDFNDVVFDASLDADKKTVHITLLAAGGTLPVYIGEQEIHAAFGVATSIPVNVGLSGDMGTRNITYTYTSEMADLSDAVTNIPITVGNPSEDETSPLYFLPLDAHKRNKSNAPQAFAVPVGVRWTCESQQIENAYPGFTAWVKDEGNYTSETNGMEWYDNRCVYDGRPVNTYTLYGNTPGYENPPVTPGSQPSGPGIQPDKSEGSEGSDDSENSDVVDNAVHSITTSGPENGYITVTCITNTANDTFSQEIELSSLGKASNGYEVVDDTENTLMTLNSSNSNDTWSINGAAINFTLNGTKLTVQCSDMTANLQISFKIKAVAVDVSPVGGELKIIQKNNNTLVFAKPKTTGTIEITAISQITAYGVNGTVVLEYDGGPFYDYYYKLTHQSNMKENEEIKIVVSYDKLATKDNLCLIFYSGSFEFKKVVFTPDN